MVIKPATLHSARWGPSKSGTEERLGRGTAGSVPQPVRFVVGRRRPIVVVGGRLAEPTGRAITSDAIAPACARCGAGRGERLPILDVPGRLGRGVAPGVDLGARRRDRTAGYSVGHEPLTFWPWISPR